MSLTSVVIVGAGHAGVQAAASLREEGFGGEIILLSAEKDPPYQRPPLSKAFLKGEMDIHGLPLRAEAHFRDQRIDLRLGVGARAAAGAAIGSATGRATEVSTEAAMRSSGVRQTKASSVPDGETGAQRSLMTPSATQALSCGARAARPSHSRTAP